MRNVLVILATVAFASSACKQRDFNSETNSNAVAPKSYEKTEQIKTLLRHAAGVRAEIETNNITCGYSNSTVSRVTTEYTKYFRKATYGDRMFTPARTCVIQTPKFFVEVTGAANAPEGCPVRGNDKGTYETENRSSVLISALESCELDSYEYVKKVIYKSPEGCEVGVEQRKDFVILSFWKDRRNYGNIEYANDFSSADFGYCSEENTQVNHFTGSKGTGLMISCSEHQNGDAVTRGRVDISILNGELKEVKIDGQRKGWFGWKQEALLECTNLLKK